MFSSGGSAFTQSQTTLLQTYRKRTHNKIEVVLRAAAVTDSQCKPANFKVEQRCIKRAWLGVTASIITMHLPIYIKVCDKSLNVAVYLAGLACVDSVVEASSWSLAHSTRRKKFIFAVMLPFSTHSRPLGG